MARIADHSHLDTRANRSDNRDECPRAEVEPKLLDDIDVPPLEQSWRDTPLSEAEKAKVQAILEACRDHDLLALRNLAVSLGGLIEDEVRRTAWPVLLGVKKQTTETDSEAAQSWQDFPPHREEGQVDLDVNRSFVYYPVAESDARLDLRKAELSCIIKATLRRHPILCYFQGYHDIVQVLLLVLGANAAPAAAARLSLLRIRDFMLPTMSGALAHLQLLPAILRAADTELYEHLSQTAPFYFALPATLTLYAHDIQEYGDIARLFDFLLASEAVVSMYLYAVIVVSRKKELLELEADEHDMLHSILSKLPKPLDLDLLIGRAAKLFEDHPPARLRSWTWYSISSNSVLKTTSNLTKLASQTLLHGERCFKRHAAEIQAYDTRKKNIARANVLLRRYRRPAIATITTLVVAVLALYLRREGASVDVLTRPLLMLRAKAWTYLRVVI
ncbi:GTPase-activating protein gyp8 [Oleoguttula sp. CCFEE 5521]